MLTDLAYHLGWTPAWCRGLCEFYRVTPSEALRLGTRATGRRPSLPGSPTCEPVSGQTWEELWARGPRDSEETIFSFWQEVGSWCAFRQAVRHRRTSFAFLLRRLGMGRRFLEYGAGIAPASWWLLRHSPVPLQLTIADVPSEHLTFGAWRLRQRLEEDPDLCGWTLRTLALEAGRLPLIDPYQAIAVLEVLEHLSAPLETIRHLGEHLETGGWLFEDFTPHDDAHAADLPQAQKERPEVYAYLAEAFEFVDGRHWDAPDGGGIRTWRRRG